jgi:hypothetical protein
VNDVGNKMFAIARHYNSLNDKGEVKASRANEKGYARIKDIARGCTLFVHHWNDDKLVINLMITTAAKAKQESVCNQAIEALRSHFGSSLQHLTRPDQRGSNDVRDTYFVDVTDKNVNEIIATLDRITDKLRTIA